VRTPKDGASPYRWFVAVTGVIIAVHPVVPAGMKAWTYLAVPLCTVVPLGLLLRRQDRRDRLPWWLLLLGVVVVAGGEALTRLAGPALYMISESLDTVGHVCLLAAAVVLAWRRGRNDVGGLLDVSVGAMGVSALFWTTVLLPRLHVLQAGAGAQMALLVELLVLLGVLGALLRIMLVSDRPLPALTMLAGALLIALVGDVILAMTLTTTPTHAPAWVEVGFMVSYGLVGASALHPSVRELARPGPAPADRLTTRRLVFLGAAIVAGPVASGTREMIGLPADGPLLAVGSLLMAPLVMIRVGRLASQRRQAEEALHHQATHDLLTGLPNRAELLHRLDVALRRERDTGRPAVVVLFCDLNGFKDVNDRLGHLAGDRLLTDVGNRIGTGLRSGETLARYGGDEFLVLCEAPAQEDAVLRLCAHIETVLDRPFLLGGQYARISSSVGAVISDGATDADELITRADQAMYRAKQEHRATATRLNAQVTDITMLINDG
jgi:diguanylate cyclase (GGDEF)-like protein